MAHSEYHRPLLLPQKIGECKSQLRYETLQVFAAMGCVAGVYFLVFCSTLHPLTISHLFAYHTGCNDRMIVLNA